MWKTGLCEQCETVPVWEMCSHAKIKWKERDTKGRLERSKSTQKSEREDKRNRERETARVREGEGWGFGGREEARSDWDSDSGRERKLVKVHCYFSFHSEKFVCNAHLFFLSLSYWTFMDLGLGCIQFHQKFNWILKSYLNFVTFTRGQLNLQLHTNNSNVSIIISCVEILPSKMVFRKKLLVLGKSVSEACVCVCVCLTLWVCESSEKVSRNIKNGEV